MNRVVAFGMIMLVSATLSTGCAQIEDLMGTGTPPATAAPPPSPPPPQPTPAITQGEAKRFLARWIRAHNKAAKKYDIKAFAKLQTGSLLKAQRAEVKILRRNGVRIARLRTVSDIAIPRFTGWPKWFAVRMTGSNVKERDSLVFVRQRQGAPWLATYQTVWWPKISKSLRARVRTPADARVVPPGDTTLAVTPAQLPELHAHVSRYGKKSRHWRRFGAATTTISESEGILADHRLFKQKDWRGRTTVSPARYPAYAVRTASGGALVFYALDLRSTYRRAGGDATFGWRARGWGELFPALTGRTLLENRLSRLVRTEFATYIPPKGKGKIFIIASRWAPVSAKGS